MQCPGCQAKVVVKHSALLGKSLPCPKCKHAIVVPKQGPISNPSGAPSREPSPSFDSTALTKEDYGDWDEVLSNLPQNLTGVDPEQIDWSPIGGNDGTSDSTIHFQPVDTAPPQPSTASDWQSKNVKKRRQLLLVATIAVLSSVLAGIGFFSFLSFMKDDQVVQAGNKQLTEENANGAPVQTDGKSEPTKETEPKPDSNPALPDEKESPQIPPGEQTANGDGKSVPVVIPSANSNTTNATDSNSSDNNGTANSGAPNMPDKGSSETALPGKGDLASDGKPEESTTTTDVAAELAYKLPPELQRVKDLLNNSRGTFGSDAGFRPPSSVDDLDLESLQYPEMDIFHPEAKMLGDWKQASSLSIPRMSAPNDVPLALGLEGFARITNIGITIDWQACRARGVQSNPLVSIKFENKTIAGFLDEVLASEGLRLNLDPKGFPIVAPASLPEKSTASVKWNVSEICAAGFEKETAELLISMCNVKDYCSYVDGGLVWNENASLIDKAMVYETIRHLAKITGKPIPSWPSTELFKETQFSVDNWRDSRSAANRTLPDAAFVLESRSAISILQEAAMMVDNQIIVDWKSAWGHGLTPTEEMILVLRNRTFAQVSKKLLVEYALELIPIDSRTFWLTTGKVRQMSLCVVPIKPPAELNMDLVKRTLAKLRPIGDDGLSRFQLRPVPGMQGIYFARICPPNINTIFQEEFASVFGWQ
jgi:hypothetical protein